MSGGANCGHPSDIVCTSCPRSPRSAEEVAESQRAAKEIGAMWAAEERAFEERCRQERRQDIGDDWEEDERRERAGWTDDEWREHNDWLHSEDGSEDE